jgi:protein-S-isoprenylcysteine O-methyltransferase Ste14
MTTIDETVMQTTSLTGNSLDPEAVACAPRAQDVLVETGARLGAASLLGLFVYSSIVHWLADPTRVTLILLVIAECMTLGYSLFSRVPVRRDWTPVAFVCSIAATYYFLAVQLAPGIKLVPEAMGATLQTIGILWQLFAKASLRRSFGILPANRGIVSRGAYRFVRHPIYLGYLIGDVAFLLVNFGLQNMVVYAIVIALQYVRIVREERLLDADENYRTYRNRVRFRVIPGVF